LEWNGLISVVFERSLGPELGSLSLVDDAEDPGEEVPGIDARACGGNVTHPPDDMDFGVGSFLDDMPVMLNDDHAVAVDADQGTSSLCKLTNSKMAIMKHLSTHETSRQFDAVATIQKITLKQFSATFVGIGSTLLVFKKKHLLLP